MNIAGPRESKAKGIQEMTRELIGDIISTLQIVEKHFPSHPAAESSEPMPPASAPNSAS